MESARGFYLLHGQLIVQILSLSCAHKDVGSRCLPFLVVNVFPIKYMKISMLMALTLTYESAVHVLFLPSSNYRSSEDMNQTMYIFKIRRHIHL